eukprot:CAMPEP_0184368174 /NCGR_PEP_ID=MMETSP1089-20130417/161496_1 /TAXON_ID=38269 ORGANISM="Gloeochaete wittrockiana, Strain SAG46.84" /NCGR_SAMPLE_ID=MMETSP1089 /ASSEMBLY_ACC=CAM_ASM_000445 /LENGTH=152 /DNA_ID=CAMNT_0026710385 /DNA_START=430 /DNA_END=888 /DNA_ORIENTATION=+
MTAEPAPKGNPVWFVNPSGEGDFGFGWNAEKWNGRLAMLGFAAGIGQEALTGQSIFHPVWFVNPSGEGDFGFGWNAEKWNGRLAMLGFAAGIGQEALTGQSIFQQIGLDAPLDRLLVLLALLAVSIAVPLGYVAVKGPQPSFGALGEEVDLD